MAGIGMKPIVGHHTFIGTNLECGYDHVPVIAGVNVTVNSGEVLCLLGPNGIGKTTLFRSMLGLLPLIAGTVTIDGQDVMKLSRRKFADLVAYVPQSHGATFAFSVMDIVLTGCASHLGIFSSPTAEQLQRAREVMHELGILSLENRNYSKLSGGQRQMALIARAMMQNGTFMVMDEPTASLDIGRQMVLLAKVKELAESGRGIIMATHNPDQCFLCGTKVLLMGPNRELIYGLVDDVVTEPNMLRTFGVVCSIVTTEDKHGHPVKACVPLLR